LVWATGVGLQFKGTLKDSPLPDTPPSVTTIVPARNEERNIDRCVRGLVQQHYSPLEMVFVDDDSQDATPHLLAQHAGRDARIRVVHTTERPAGWNGKQWACHTGYQQAAGEWLCFMDADTYAEPDLLRRAVAFALAHDIDFLTLQPWYELGGLWERIVLPATLMPLLLLFPPHRVNNPDDNLVIANGQFILVRRDAYEQSGGHEAVRNRMMDDFPLARNVHSSGFRVFVADGASVMRVRLYTNLREIWRGGLKAAVEITNGWRTSAVVLAINLVINVLPVVLFVWMLAARNWVAAAIMGSVVVLQAVYQSAIRVVAFRAPPWSGITYPVGSAIGSLILIDGMFRLASGRQIKWKDRPVLGGPEVRIRPGHENRRE
jgi:chlorobactene glucosyltransferase